MRRNAEVPGDGLESLSAEERLDGGSLALRRKPVLAICCFLSVARASIPYQAIGSASLKVISNFIFS